MNSALTIRSNISSLDAQQRLGDANQQLRQSFDRLSSGLRINRASDDAAGLAIASWLRTDSRVFATAVRNVNDAISLTSIADGAMSQMTSVVIRLKELAAQSANGVLGSPQRSSIDAEAQALRSEFNRILSTTTFNGINPLDGTTSSLNVQTGYQTTALALPTLGTSTVGTGSFQSRVSYASPGTPEGAIAADINNDGKADLVDTLGDIFLGNGDGTFLAAKTGLTNFSYAVRAIDTNSDGTLDLVGVQKFTNVLVVARGNGDGTFVAPVSFTVDSVSNGYEMLDVADINGDGSSDAIVVAQYSGKIDILLGNGNGTFKARTSIAGLGGAAKLVDVSHDGKLDIVEADASGANNVSVFIGNGDGTFKARVSYGGGFYSEFSVADVNGDGNLDFIAPNSQSSSGVEVMLGNSNGTLRAGVDYNSLQVSTVTLGDTNGDGIFDIIATNYSSNTVAVSLGNGDGSFRSQTSFSTGSNPQNAVVADLNGDGVSDVVVSSRDAPGSMDVLLATTTTISALAAFSLGTQSGALSAMPLFDGSLVSLTASHGQLGSIESRLQAAGANLQQSVIGFDQAASRIVDVDVAQESANLARLTIVQQASGAVLAQANQQPALALRLLQGI